MYVKATTLKEPPYLHEPSNAFTLYVPAVSPETGNKVLAVAAAEALNAGVVLPIEKTE